MRKSILAVSVIALSSLSLASLADSDSKGKATVCHKGMTVTINQSGTGGHLGHGDTLGSCESRRAAIVMLRCEPTDGVVSVSSSPSFEVDIDEGANCAGALADLLDEGLTIRSVTGGSADSEGVLKLYSDYLLEAYFSMAP